MAGKGGRIGNPTHFSLFTGIGGIDLSAEWAGFQTVGQCELADYPCKVLCKHWPDVPKWRDIRDVTNESVRAAGIERITVLSGGFPCQPFSLAGKRRGKEDDRYLWPEMFRVIQELRPTWVLGENVTGIDGLALDDVLSHLESIGYETAPPLEIPACAVNAVHVRERIFILAHSSKDVAYTDSAGQQKFNSTAKSDFKRHDTRGITQGWATGSTKPGLGGMFNGPPGGVHRPPAPLGCEQYEWEPPRVAKGIKKRRQQLECLGNMVMPWQVYPILKAIYEIETRRLT